MTDLCEILPISDEPIYNAKAVTRQTGVTPATLRAWVTYVSSGLRKHGSTADAQGGVLCEAHFSAPPGTAA
jgi:hypothetical protein